jgi:four helix bundle protein
LKETRRWLHLIAKVPLIKEPTRVSPLLAETEELVKIFASSIRTARNRKTSR